MRTRRALVPVAFTTLFAIVTGCAIQADSGPRDVPADAEARDNIESDAAGAEATGEGRIYLLASDGGEQRLRTVLRASKDLLQNLISGPNDQEVSEGLASEVPSSLVVNDQRAEGGVLIIDVSDDLNELAGANLRLAIAQIVFTATEIPGTEAVSIRVDGRSQSWPTGDGTLVSRPLTVYDFVGFADSSQPDYPVTPRGSSNASAETTTTAVAATTSVPAATVPGETTTLPPAEATTTAPSTG